MLLLKLSAGVHLVKPSEAQMFCSSSYLLYLDCNLQIIGYFGVLLVLKGTRTLSCFTVLAFDTSIQFYVMLQMVLCTLCFSNLINMEFPNVIEFRIRVMSNFYARPEKRYFSYW